MQVLTTGDTGFIGRNLKKFLADKDFEIIGFSRHQGLDVLDYEKVIAMTNNIDIVYHLAAYAKPAESVINPVEAIETNIKGMLNVLEACKKNNFTLVYPSTCEIYGNSRQPINEDYSINPPNPYAASKAACDRLAYTYSRVYSLDIKILRLFNPYGPFQQLNKIIPTFYFQAIEGKPITVYGDGTDTRDYTYIDDIIEAFYLGTSHLPSGDAVNICTGKATTNYEIAHMIKKLTGSASSIIFTDYPKVFGGIKNQVGSYEKAKRLMRWKPKVQLEEGLRRTIKWLGLEVKK